MDEFLTRHMVSSFSLGRRWRLPTTSLYTFSKISFQSSAQLRVSLHETHPLCKCDGDASRYAINPVHNDDRYVVQGGPCCKEECNVCNICANGFNFNRSGDTARKTGIHLRYGKGLYFSSISGKANDYAGQSEKVCGQVFPVCPKYGCGLQSFYHTLLP